MSTRDLLLAELYQSPRNAEAQAIAARNAPVLYFDAREPFLPLAAGYSLFYEDGPSPSFKRVIELKQDDQPPAALAIEYAIWWDWDMHHLYELEHVWVYLNAHSHPCRVEASWHGKYYNIPLKLEDGHAVLLSEPGKHAFAPDPSWFHQRTGEYRRAETQAVGLHAHVLINSMFSDKIRSRAFDRVLARSYLAKQTFDPSWSFTQRFTFFNQWLVPWPALHAWIPERVNAVLERLENTIQPAEYRALRLSSAEGTLAGLKAAADAGADAIITPLSLRSDHLVLGNGHLPQPIGLDEALEFCQREPIGAFLELDDPGVVERLAWFIRSNDLNEYIVVTSADAGLLARYSAFVADCVTAIQIATPDQDPLQAARQSVASFVHPRWDSGAALDADWTRRVHDAGLGVISGPVESAEEADALQRMGLDVIWEKNLGQK